MISISEKVINRVINWSEFKKYKLNSIDIFQKNRDGIVAEGERRYKNERLVSCREAQGIIAQLDDLTRQLP